jgi:hypothetical protein
MFGFGLPTFPLSSKKVSICQQATLHVGLEVKEAAIVSGLSRAYFPLF